MEVDCKHCGEGIFEATYICTVCREVDTGLLKC